MSKKKRNKPAETNDTTAFSKSDWYGKGRRGRSKKKSKKTVYIKHNDKQNNKTVLAEILVENDNIVIKDTRND